MAHDSAMGCPLPMTTTRSLMPRLALAATALLLGACSSSDSEMAQAPPAPVSQAAPGTAESDVAAEMVETSEGADMADVDASDDATDEAAVEPMAGAYIDLATYEADKAAFDQGDVVLFFNADWCSTCKEARDNLTAADADIPDGLVIVTVDYDNSDELKRQYGVTVQHTFVQVDADGSERAKWSGSVTADEIRQQTV